MSRSTPLAIVAGLSLSLGLTGCGDDTSGMLFTTDSGSPTGEPTSSDAGDTSRPTTTTSTTDTPSTTSTTDTPSTTTMGTTATTDDTDTDTLPEFEFDETPPGDYQQVDRMGVPAVNAALLLSDAYNQATPADDTLGPFSDELRAGVVNLHSAFDPDLKASSTLCSLEDCMTQVNDLVVPDALLVDLTEYSGFPNGRLPRDRVMDMMFSAVLLDQSVEDQDLFSLVGMSPMNNDADFSEFFPYFGEPH